MSLKRMDVDLLRSLIDYDPETGVCTRKSDGEPAGYWHVTGYRYIGIGEKKWPASRLAWAIVTGRFPDRVVDHINRDKTDDRWVNLRLATRRQNMMNASLRVDNTTGYKGVSQRANGRYRAQIRAPEGTVFLGCYDTAEAAHAAYMDAAARMFGEYATNGLRA